ncbi:hypothetical protein MBM_04839 [Drepanopeziza brunnea f. sp. 'multigermtubi' MB_m1]|uniref:Uncharacterized protein n=1 Tax=Marssonina brunnea f. sp. multigermtubi (strain MB_m1) TaxID=1072389 RepID=K1WXJ4_MARBU|nr:uncharacterized protein MBM_04839 [Drepanopeziza brunnea f. sp. 'multigermtubi' MB_m1]EKD17262.1 hypothetical protein MBM_04839 [Drepanopeziza brunnea f. sp. 'multigermtubi' MB_m1]
MFRSNPLSSSPAHSDLSHPRSKPASALPKLKTKIQQGHKNMGSRSDKGEIQYGHRGLILAPTEQREQHKDNAHLGESPESITSPSYPEAKQGQRKEECQNTEATRKCNRTYAFQIRKRNTRKAKAKQAAYNSQMLLPPRTQSLEIRHISA